MLISKSAIFVNIFLSENNTGAMKKNIKNHKIHYHNLQLSFKHINLLNAADFLGKTTKSQKSISTKSQTQRPLLNPVNVSAANSEKYNENLQPGHRK